MSQNDKSPWIGRLPKIGIRPTIDGRRGGVRESLENQTMDMARSAAEFISASLRHPNGKPVECVIADTCIGGVAEAAACAEKFAREGVGVSLTVTPVLVLRQRDDGHGPARFPKRSGASTAPNGPARFIWRRCWPATRRRACRRSAFTDATCRTAATRRIPADVQEKLLRFARAGLAVAMMRGKSYLWHGRRLDGHRRLHRGPAVLRRLSGHARRDVDMTRIRPAHGRGNLRPGRIQEGAGVGEGKLPGRQGLQFAEAQQRARQLDERMGKCRQDGAHRARSDGRQSPAGRDGLRRGSARPQRHRRRLPRPAAMDGPLSPTAISWKRSSTRPSTGTASARRTLSPRKTTASTALRMLFGYLLTNTAQIFADVRTYWSPDAVKRVTGHKLDGRGRRRHSAPDQFRPGHARRHRRTDRATASRR